MDEVGAREEEDPGNTNITSLPYNARCTDDFDCVLLTARADYHSQVVRLAAFEKGIKFKNYNIDIKRRLSHYEPWYITLKP